MEYEIIVRLFILGTLLLLSAFFSGSEVAFFSLDPLARKRAAASEERSDKLLVWLLKRPRRLIITLLVGNELVNISSSTVSATIASHLFAHYSEWGRTLISIAIVVPLLLIIGEITPKTIAIIVSRGWARRAATPVFIFSILITPLRLLFRYLSDLIVNFFGGRPTPNENPLSEEAFLQLVEKGKDEGKILDKEGEMIANVFKFGDSRVKNVMTPINRVYTMDISTPFEELSTCFKNGMYSRIPVMKAGEVVGILHAKDVLMSAKGSVPVSELIKPPFYVSMNTKCLRLVNEFQNRRIHLAIVLNQHGKMAGLVTMEDLLEELVGEIHDEKERMTSVRGDAS
ncbi:hemolysin family protein [Myxococcota bacterium]|nr:hemolysin family protein [Myxococcota bacterium]MBU1496650.1 hemolysin family protein [Myxococcota bacterium]